MPDKRQHRGQHPQDRELFAPNRWVELRLAVRDFSWLLSRGYAHPSALKVVGDRYSLDARQRMAIMRASCSDQARDKRQARELTVTDLRSRPLAIDGYNILTTIEAALAGGIILHCRDGAIRDIASIHGTYRKVEETTPALELLTNVLRSLSICTATWYLDRPVSRAKRLLE